MSLLRLAITEPEQQESTTTTTGARIGPALSELVAAKPGDRTMLDALDPFVKKGREQMPFVMHFCRRLSKRK